MLCLNLESITGDFFTGIIHLGVYSLVWLVCVFAQQKNQTWSTDDYSGDYSDDIPDYSKRDNPILQ
jgi:hypothetical protein